MIGSINHPRVPEVVMVDLKMRRHGIGRGEALLKDVEMRFVILRVEFETVRGQRVADDLVGIVDLIGTVITRVG